MKNKMRFITVFLSAMLLLAGYLLSRYVLFDLHGMKQWPLTLLIVGALVAGVAWILRARIIPLSVSAAYTVSFPIGALLQTNSVGAGGTATNNLWIIWTGVYLIIILVAIIAELICRFGVKNS